MGKNFHYKGNLEQTFLSDMLALIFRHNVPGALEVSRDDCIKKLFISSGNVVHATSTDREDRLDSQLLRIGALTREELLGVTRARTETDRMHGQLLIEHGLLSPRELYEAIRGQMEAIVWSLFSWQSGEVSFRIGEAVGAGMIKIHLPMRQVIVRGLKEAADTKSLVARLGNKWTVFKPSYRTEDLIELALDEDEYALLRLLDGERRFYDVCNTGPFDMSGNARLIYAFRLLGLVEKVEPDAGQVKMRMGADKQVHGV